METLEFFLLCLVFASIFVAIAIWRLGSILKEGLDSHYNLVSLFYTRSTKHMDDHEERGKRMDEKYGLHDVPSSYFSPKSDKDLRREL